jgi:hypothetical protein
MKAFYLLLTCLIVLSGCEGFSDVEASNVTWRCTNNICDVTYFIYNNTNNNIQAKYAIRAHKRVNSGNGGIGAQGNKIIGEEKGTIMITSNSKKEIKQQIKTSTKPTNIVVSVWQ